MTAQASRLKSREQINDGIDAGGDDGLQENERSLSANIAIELARKNAKDVLLNEAASIVADEADLQAGVR
jgi:carboxyl-terminal processing protease